MNKERLRFLFTRYVANRISKSELAELEASLGRTADDHELRRLVTEEFQEAEWDNDTATPEDEKWLQGLEMRVWERISRTPVPAHTRIFAWRKAIAVAASVVIVSIASIWVFFEFGDDNQRTMQVADIGPGTNRASLTLADGSKIDLSTSQIGIVVGSRGITYQDGTTEIANLESETTNMLVLNTPRGGQYQLTLPDGTRVWLNAESTLKYPSRFTGGRREVEVYGEAYFSVVQDDEQPFTVRSQGQEIEVLGTEFNVSAYSDEPAIRTTLVEGAVQIVNKLSERVSRLFPGQQAVVSGLDTDVRKVDARDYIAWKDGIIVLNQADLPAIARQIERWYNVEFEIPLLPPTEPVFGELRRDVNLSELLQSLHLHYGLDFRMEGRRIVAEK